MCSALLFLQRFEPHALHCAATILISICSQGCRPSRRNTQCVHTVSGPHQLSVRCRTAVLYMYSSYFRSTPIFVTSMSTTIQETIQATSKRRAIQYFLRERRPQFLAVLPPLNVPPTTMRDESMTGGQGVPTVR